ncbi:sigma-70 family RNA polymerase sigma factor [Amycolatopsis alkalitolerans]|uniref:Sigma-70 family RNA polymerase sigma factor n=1 Tax=Amycolatopsis alkalitolerans TaxID=2547244 RepID=A0A5C4MBC6_9PSEU|nr:sigma-70 family RNA polymerase sigma factor [Amycolatopsis alkalitolerans]TNC29580.1 sigma-70 family RNA polymerase sigma factor [Amycolatopsis alkalitolerans]
MDSEAEDLIRAHLPWVHHMVAELTARIPRHVDRDDLTSVALLALVSSAHAYERDRGVPFARFAAARVRGAMLDELRALDGASRMARRLARQVNAGRESLTALLGRTPKARELAHYLNLPLIEMDAALHEVHQATSVRLEDFTADLAANLLPDEAPGPEEIALHEERIRGLREAIARLPPRNRRIVVECLLHERPKSELAAELSISRPRVSQLCANAIDRLRATLCDGPGSENTRSVDTRCLNGPDPPPIKTTYPAVTDRRRTWVSKSAIPAASSPARTWTPTSSRTSRCPKAPVPDGGWISPPVPPPGRPE